MEEYFKKKQVGRLKLFRLAEQMGVPTTEAVEVGEEMYRRMAGVAFRDGRLSEKEAARLNRFAEVLKVSDAARSAADRDAKLDTVSRAVEAILADGRVTEAEASQLEALADRLGIPRRTVQEHVAERVGEAFISKIHGLMHHGHFTEADEAEVQQFRGTFGLGAAVATRLLERDADVFLREFLTDLAEREDAAAESADDLRRLGRVLGVRPDMLRPHLERLSRLVELAEISRGTCEQSDAHLNCKAGNCATGTAPPLMRGRSLPVERRRRERWRRPRSG